MNSMVKRSLVLLFLICLFLPVSGWALNEETHRDINQFIGGSTNSFNGFSLDLFLKNQLGFQDGKNQIIANQFIAQEVYKWLGEGLSKKAIHNKSDYLIMDEVGKLELNNKGWYSAIERALKEYKGILILAVRTEFVKDILQKWQLENTKVIQLENFNKNIYSDFLL